MAIGDLWRIAFEYSFWGQNCVNVMHFQQKVSLPRDDAQGVADVACTVMRDVYAPLLCRQQRGLTWGATVSQISRLAGDGAQASIIFGDGGVDTPPISSMLAAVLRLRTGLADKTRRGRIFIAGIAQVSTTGNNLNPGGTAAMEGFMARLQTNFMGNAPVTGLQLGVFSRERYKILSNPFDEYFKPVTQLAAPTTLATMRSRKPGIGQ